MATSAGQDLQAEQQTEPTVGFVGAGMMATAMINGIIAAKVKNDSSSTRRQQKQPCTRNLGRLDESQNTALFYIDTRPRREYGFNARSCFRAASKTCTAVEYIQAPKTSQISPSSYPSIQYR